MVINCNHGNLCNIYCGVHGACRDTVIYCSGVCNVTCDYGSTCPDIIYDDSAGRTCSPIPQPTVLPTIPTMTPTFNPSVMPSAGIGTTGNIGNMTDNGGENNWNNFLSVSQLSAIYNYFLLSSVLFVVILLVLSFMDGKFIRRNEQYKPTGIIFFGAYSLDFVSGM